MAAEPEPIVGATTSLRARFYDLDGVPLVPDTVTLDAIYPSGERITATLGDGLEPIEDGWIRHRFKPSERGPLRCTWTATQGAGATETTVIVQKIVHVRGRIVPPVAA